MIDPEIQQYVQQQIAAAQNKSLYSTKNYAYHLHNGIDSPVNPSTASTGIFITSNTGKVIIRNVGVTSVAGGTATTVSSSTGAVIVNNVGVTSLVAGTSITLSSGTGAVTVSNVGITKISTGNFLRTSNAATGTQAILHNLGVVPKLVKMTGFASGLSSGAAYSYSCGTFDGTTMNEIQAAVGNSGATSVFSNNTTNILSFYDISIAGVQQSVKITVDSVNLNLSWTYGGTATMSSIPIVWEAYG